MSMHLTEVKGELAIEFEISHGNYNQLITEGDDRILQIRDSHFNSAVHKTVERWHEFSALDVKAILRKVKFGDTVKPDNILEETRLQVPLMNRDYPSRITFRSSSILVVVPVIIFTECALRELDEHPVLWVAGYGYHFVKDLEQKINSVRA